MKKLLNWRVFLTILLVLLLICSVSYGYLEESSKNTYLEEYVKEFFIQGYLVDNEDIEIDVLFTDIDSNGMTDAIGIARSVLTCGSRGCSTRFFLVNEAGDIHVLEDMFVFQSISVLSTSTNGMRDVASESRIFKWNGSRYVASFD